MIKHQKPHSFYDTFERKGTGQKVTHYCPGCGHGNVHKIIAEAIDDLGIQDKIIFCSPVGCSVFAYYYFDVGNIQCSHGRAPAVATGIRRVLPESIIISYQGDGDLAGIGTTEIIHAANRGENLTVFFVNNAIYGMTGGQMAPTTLVGQKTITTPIGRSQSNDGMPIGMAEIIDAIKAPVFIERVSLATPAKVLKARKVIRQALSNQVEKKGFSFVEILSPCPINWKMEPVDARKWIETHMEPIFPVKRFRDKTGEEESAQFPTQQQCGDTELVQMLNTQTSINQNEDRVLLQEQQLIKISGFGGQGVMSAGVLLAHCAMAEGYKATWLPSYGPEMRGGTANSSIIISRTNIGSPVVDISNVLLAMNLPSLDTFESKVASGGFIFVNSSLVSRTVERNDVKVIYIPASDLASKEGLLPAANVIMISLYILISKVVDIKTLQQILPLNLKNKKYLDLNLKMIQLAQNFYEENKLYV